MFGGRRRPRWVNPSRARPPERRLPPLTGLCSGRFELPRSRALRGHVAAGRTLPKIVPRVPPNHLEGPYEAAPTAVRAARGPARSCPRGHVRQREGRRFVRLRGGARAAAPAVCAPAVAPA